MFCDENLDNKPLLSPNHLSLLLYTFESNAEQSNRFFLNKTDNAIQPFKILQWFPIAIRTKIKVPTTTYKLFCDLVPPGLPIDLLFLQILYFIFTDLPFYPTPFQPLTYAVVSLAGLIAPSA